MADVYVILHFLTTASHNDNWCQWILSLCCEILTGIGSLRKPTFSLACCIGCTIIYPVDVLSCVFMCDPVKLLYLVLFSISGFAIVLKVAMAQFCASLSSWGNQGGVLAFLVQHFEKSSVEELTPAVVFYSSAVVPIALWMIGDIRLILLT